MKKFRILFHGKRSKNTLKSKPTLTIVFQSLDGLVFMEFMLLVRPQFLESFVAILALYFFAVAAVSSIRFTTTKILKEIDFII